MDSGSSADAASIDVSKLSDRDKQELQVFVNNETQRARIQQAVHNLTETCWKKCVTGSIRSGQLERGEESCAQNCVNRFLDGNTAILKHLEAMRNQS